jgi:hypothetical protein
MSPSLEPTPEQFERLAVINLLQFIGEGEKPWWDATSIWASAE